jgi:hypothetical protein
LPKSPAARAAVSLLSEVAFAAALVYSPRGSSEVSQNSRRQIRDPLKRGDAELLQAITIHLREPLRPTRILLDFLTEDAVLVPVPRSAPLTTKDALWPARLLCQALVAGGMGARIYPCLVRTERVDKSAFAEPGSRPTAQRHYDTMRVARELLDPPARITIVDDFVTKGRTMIAAASRVQEAFPDAVVRAFALVRTMGLVPEIERVGDPCVGWVTYDGSEAHREP